MKLEILKGFAFAHGGIRVVEYQAGTTVETDDAELVAVATAEGWAAEAGAAPAAPKAKARKAAPENK